MAAKRKGFRFFSVGEHGLCSGFNEKRFSDTEKRHDECQGKTPNRNHCNDNDTFVACVGSSNHEYVYELVSVLDIYVITKCQSQTYKELGFGIGNISGVMRNL